MSKLLSSKFKWVAWLSCVKGIQGFSNLKKDITKLTMDGCTAINFVKHVKIGFWQSWCCLCCMMVFAGAFTTKQQVLVMHPHCFVYYDKTWMKTVLTCFTKMIAEQSFLTQYERPMYHMREKINMLSSTDNNFIIYLFDFERFSIESRFPFFFFFLLTLYIQRINPPGYQRSALERSPSEVWHFNFS